MMELKKQIDDVNDELVKLADDYVNKKHRIQMLELDRQSTDINKVRLSSEKIRDIELELFDIARVRASLEAKLDALLRQASSYAEHEQVKVWNKAKIAEFELVQEYNKLCDKALSVLDALVSMPYVVKPDLPGVLKSSCGRVQFESEISIDNYRRVRPDLDVVCQRIHLNFAPDEYRTLIEGLIDGEPKSL